MKPMINQPHPALVQHGFDTAATIVADYDDVPDLQNIHGVLYDRHTIHVGVVNDIRDIAMHENLSGHQPRNLVG